LLDNIYFFRYYITLLNGGLNYENHQYQLKLLKHEIREVFVIYKYFNIIEIVKWVTFEIFVELRLCKSVIFLV